MIAFEVSIKGSILALAGIRDLGVLATTLTAGRNRATPAEEFETYVELTVGGLTGTAPREFVRWLRSHELRSGDNVNVRILEVEDVETPNDREPADPNFEQRIDREHYDAVKKRYFELKATFEPDAIDSGPA
jgi:hypothetical protein